MSQQKPPLFGGTTNLPSKTQPPVDPKKKNEAEGQINMQSSIVMPSTLKQPQEANKTSTTPLQTQSSPQKVQSTNAPKQVKVEKTGGVLNAPKQTSHRKRRDQFKTGPQQILPTKYTFEQIISNLLLLDTIYKNQKASEDLIKEWVEMFRLTQDFQKRQEDTQLFKKQDTRDKLFEKDTFLNTIRANKSLTSHVIADFSTLCLRLIQKYPYLNNQACVMLIHQYIQLNRIRLYTGRFQYDLFRQTYHQFENSRSFYNILNSMIEIKQHLFLNYVNVLKYFVEKIRNKEVEKCILLDKLMKNPTLLTRFVGNLWHTFSNILKFQVNLPNKKDAFDCEIELIVQCLNLCFQLKSNFFTKEVVTKEVFPLLQRAIYAFQRSTLIRIAKIDKFVLNLVLVKPFTIATFSSDRELKQFLHSRLVEQRYNYLFLLSNQLDVSSLLPLEHVQQAAFLQNYLKLNQDIDSYSQAKNIFILNSICQMFKQKYGELSLNKPIYRYIWKYIEHIVNSILDDDQISQDSENQFTYMNTYLNVCRLAKIINRVSLPNLSNGIFQGIFNQLLRSNKHNAFKFLNKAVQLIRITDDVQKIEYSRIQEFLGQNSISTEVIFEFFYKLIIHDVKYLQKTKTLLNQNGFQSLGRFYEVLITSYVFNFYNRANIYDYNMLAYSCLIKTQIYVNTCKGIAQTLSSLRNSDMIIMDEENNEVIKNELESAVEKMLDIKIDYDNNSNFQAYGKLILAIFDHDRSLLQTPFIKAMLTRMKKLTSNYHPIVMIKYTESLLGVLKHLNQIKDFDFNIENYFEFKHINEYLHSALAFEFNRQNSLIVNKYMSYRKFRQVSIAVQLIKNMTILYLKQTENRLQRTPYQIKRMMEKQNRGSDYQLVFTKEATSYAFPIAVLLLSKQLVLDAQLNIRYPNLKEDLFECLINLKKICNLLRYEMSFRICYLYNRRTDSQMNQNIRIESTLIQSIKRNPSYIGFEYMLLTSEGRMSISKQLFEKLIDKKLDITTLVSQARFVLVYWNALAQNALKISFDEGWNNVLDLIFNIRQTLLSSDLDQNRAIINSVLPYIFEFSLSVKKNNLELYGKFLFEFFNFFIDYSINNFELQEKSTLADEAMTYFFSIKSLLPTHVFQEFIKEERIQDKLQQYVLRCLEINQNFVSKNNVEEEVLLMIELGIVCAFDICPLSRKMQKWMQIILQKTLRKVQAKTEPTVRQITILMLVCGKLETEFPARRVGLSGDYWQLIINCLKPEVRVGQLLYLEFQDVYMKHEIFFVSFCSFFKRLIRAGQFQNLLNYHHISLKRNFLQIVQTMLIRSIQEHKSYYVIWLIQLLTEIVQSQENKKYKDSRQQNFYFQISALIFNDKIVKSRIDQLFEVLAYKLGIQCRFNKVGSKRDGNQRFTISMKQQLLAYVRLMTILYFSKQKDEYQSELSTFQDITLNQTIGQRQIEFIQLAYQLVPLFAELIKFNEVHIDLETEVQQKLFQMKVDKLRASKVQKSGIKEVLIDQAHRMWSEKYTLFNLLDQVLNYQLISICSVWISLALDFGQGRPVFHASIYKDSRFDAKANNLVYFLQAVIEKLQDFRAYPAIISDILKQFDLSVYNSLALSKQMMFTNCNSLNAHIDINYEQIVHKLSQIVFVVYKMLQHIFSEKKALKSSSVLNFKKIIKKLKSVEQTIIQLVDPHFVVEMKSTSYRTDSENISRNYTIRNK